MTRNPILEELHEIRETLLADAGGDLQRFLAGVREREAASGRLLGPSVGADSSLAPSVAGPCVEPSVLAVEPSRSAPK